MQKVKSRIVFYKYGGVDFVESKITDCLFTNLVGLNLRKHKHKIRILLT